jgi:hypothetical protein
VLPGLHEHPLKEHDVAAGIVCDHCRSNVNQKGARFHSCSIDDCVYDLCADCFGNMVSGSAFVINTAICFRLWVVVDQACLPYQLMH